VLVYYLFILWSVLWISFMYNLHIEKILGWHKLERMYTVLIKY